MKQKLLSVLFLFVAIPLFGHDVLRVYGPGGPAPAMKEAAAAFQQQSGIAVEVTAGPSEKWMKKARRDADLVFSGSEHMMSSFITALKPAIAESSVRPLYIRRSAVLVRPGNPKQIGGIRDLLAPGMRVMVVEGAGQVGLWEDVVGRLGRIEDVRAFRSNIVAQAKNSGDAKTLWTTDRSIDAWLIWNIWGVANDDITDIVEIEPDLRIWRDCGIAMTSRGSKKSYAADFVSFLQSEAGRAIFTRWGWQ